MIRWFDMGLEIKADSAATAMLTDVAAGVPGDDVSHRFTVEGSDSSGPHRSPDGAEELCFDGLNVWREKDVDGSEIIFPRGRDTPASAWIRRSSSSSWSFGGSQAEPWHRGSELVLKQIIEERVLTASGVFAHGAMVISPGGRGILLVGDATAGKTTTALRIAQAGGYFVSGDRTGLVASEGNILGMGAAQSTRLRESSFPILGLTGSAVDDVSTRVHMRTSGSADPKSILTHGQLEKLGFKTAHGNEVSAVVHLSRTVGEPFSVSTPPAVRKREVLQRNVRASRYMFDVEGLAQREHGEADLLASLPMRSVVWNPTRDSLDLDIITEGFE